MTRVVVLLDNGSAHGPNVARALAEAGVAVLTVHGQGRAPEGRGHYAGDPSDPFDVETATTMATDLFGPVDAVVDVADLPADPSAAVDAVSTMCRFV
jgi:hypothetical protein